MIKKCKVCHIEKELTYVKTDKWGKRQFTDDTGRYWKHSKCPDCENKRFHIPKQNITCKECGTIFQSANQNHHYCSKECRYKETLRRINNYIKKKREPNKHSKAHKTCKQCKVEFCAVHTSQMEYCSIKCQSKFNRNKKPKVERAVQTKHCVVCSTEFKTVSNNAMYCGTKCSSKAERMRKPRVYKGRKRKLSPKQSRRKYAHKLFRKLKKEGFVPNWANKKAILDFYVNTPEDHEVDHIIPLRNPTVRGYHTLENLQYLRADLNLAKSNRFDGTYDNSLKNLSTQDLGL